MCSANQLFRRAHEERGPATKTSAWIGRATASWTENTSGLTCWVPSQDLAILSNCQILLTSGLPGGIWRSQLPIPYDSLRVLQGVLCYQLYSGLKGHDFLDESMGASRPVLWASCGLSIRVSGTWVAKSSHPYSSRPATTASSLWGGPFRTQLQR